MNKFRKGQSTLEYVIILAAVVGAIIAVGALLKPRLQNSYSDLSGKMQDKVGQVTF
jgi:Flp pilus assembly pilin Flp